MTGADAQDRLAAVLVPVLRDSIKIRMTGLGPNAESVIRNGGAVHLTPAEAEEVAAHVAAALAPVVAEVRAEALREAARDIARAREDGLATGETGHPTHPYIETWLRARADRGQP